VYHLLNSVPADPGADPVPVDAAATEPDAAPPGVGAGGEHHDPRAAGAPSRLGPAP